MSNMWLNYKGQYSYDYDIECLYNLPTLSVSSKNQDTWEVPGRDGLLFAEEELVYRGNAKIECVFSFISEDYMKDIRKIRKWLSGKGPLILSETTDSYYEVAKVEIKSTDREISYYGRIKVTFTVYPYEFLTSGADEITSYASIENEYDQCRPLYKITGSGSGTLTVNGNTMTFSVSGTLYIDTRRMIAYDGSGNPKDGTINGDYAGLYLVSGTNSVTCSAGTLTIVPRWGYYL